MASLPLISHGGCCSSAHWKHPGPRKGCSLQFSVTGASGGLRVLYLLIGTELWGKQKKSRQPDALCVNVKDQRTCMLFGRPWLQTVPLTARKEPLLEQGKCFSRTLHNPVSPLFSLFWHETKPNRYSHVNMSRLDIQKLCIKIITVKLTF